MFQKSLSVFSYNKGNEGVKRTENKQQKSKRFLITPNIYCPSSTCNPKRMWILFQSNSHTSLGGRWACSGLEPNSPLQQSKLSRAGFHAGATALVPCPSGLGAYGAFALVLSASGFLVHLLHLVSLPWSAMHPCDATHAAAMQTVLNQCTIG